MSASTVETTRAGVVSPSSDSARSMSHSAAPELTSAWPRSRVAARKVNSSHLTGDPPARAAAPAVELDDPDDVGQADDADGADDD